MEVDGDTEVTKTLDSSVEKEGSFLLGAPSFVNIGNGRVRCVETGHELPAKDADEYGKTKGCRISLIDAAVATKKPPLNMFKLDPLLKSKLICKLTGFTINKTEEHIWKHITGKKFLNKLEQKEVEKIKPVPVKKTKKFSKRVPNTSIATPKKDDKNDIVENIPMEAESRSNGDQSEEPEFWIPPIGERWDFDDGKYRWDSCTSSGNEIDGDDEPDGKDVLEDGVDSGDLARCTKRMSIAVGPSSFASRKKKGRKDSTNQPNND